MRVTVMDTISLKLAVLTAIENVQNGGGPFGAVIVTPTGEVFTSGNTVTQTNDPTAHAEVNVIRKACQALGVFDLSGSVLYSSCEPCPMCLGAALWARVDKVYFAANRHDAASAGFDDANFYEQIEENQVAEQVALDDFNAPFEAWERNVARVRY